MTMAEISEVILMGAGTRVPKVQEVLLAHLDGRELGKSLNTDEASAMGAVYKAADLSSGFKVKKFITRDAVIFPIDVNFERHFEDDDGKPAKKTVNKALFAKMNPFPQKKIMTFNKFQDDFEFHANINNLEYLDEKEARYGYSIAITTRPIEKGQYHCQFISELFTTQALFFQVRWKPWTIFIYGQRIESYHGKLHSR